MAVVVVLIRGRYTARVPTLGPVFAAEAVLSSDAALPVPPGGDCTWVVVVPRGALLRCTLTACCRMLLQQNLSCLVRWVKLACACCPSSCTVWASTPTGPPLPRVPACRCTSRLCSCGPSTHAHTTPLPNPAAHPCMLHRVVVSRYPILSFAVRDLQSREQRVRAAAAELLFAARQHGEKHDFAPVVAAAVAKLPIEIRDRVKDKLDSLAMEANARAELAQAVAAAGAAPGAGAGVVAGAGAVEQPAASPNRSSGGVQVRV